MEYAATTGAFADGLEQPLTARFSPPATPAVTRAERILRYVDIHYSDQLTLQCIAEAIGCARSQVAAAIKGEIGVTMHRYVARMRVRRAAELISQGEKIEAVMLLVGYRSKKNFYRQFRRATGVTPAEYRRRIRLRRRPMSRRTFTVAPPEKPAAPVDRVTMSVTVARAVELLGVSRRTVYYWIKNGRLHAIRRLDGAQRVIVEYGGGSV